MQSPREFLECDDQTPKICGARRRCTFYNDFEVYFLQPATCTNPFTIPESAFETIELSLSQNDQRMWLNAGPMLAAPDHSTNTMEP